MLKEPVAVGVPEKTPGPFAKLIPAAFRAASPAVMLQLYPPTPPLGESVTAGNPVPTTALGIDVVVMERAGLIVMEKFCDPLAPPTGSLAISTNGPVAPVGVPVI